MKLEIFKAGFYLVTRIQKSAFLKIKYYYDKIHKTLNTQGGFKMIDFSSFLKENLNGIFTTVEDGKPKSRAFQFLFSDGKKFIFAQKIIKQFINKLKKILMFLFVYINLISLMCYL